MDISLHERFKQCQVDSWTTREHLCLASAVTRNGDQNWAAVSRTIRFLTSEINRPHDWYSTKNCALQYDKLLEQVDIPKRKREKGESNLVDTPGETVTKMLSRRYMEELAGVMEEEKTSYEKLKREVQLLESDQCNNRLHQFWDELVSEQEKEDEEEKKRKIFLKEREERIKLFQTATKLQPFKGCNISPQKNLPDKDDAEKLYFGRHSGTSENSSEGDSGDEMETDSQATIANISLSPGNISLSASISSINNKSVEGQTNFEDQSCNAKSKNKQNLLEVNEKNSIIDDSNSITNMKLETSFASTGYLSAENQLPSLAVEFVKDVPLEDEFLANQSVNSSLTEIGKNEECTGSAVEFIKKDVFKVETDNLDKCEIVPDKKENKIVTSQMPEISKSNTHEFNKTAYDIKEDERILAMKNEKEVINSSDISLNHSVVDHNNEATDMEIKDENSKICKQVQKKIRQEFENDKNVLKKVVCANNQNMGSDETKVDGFLEDFDKSLETVSKCNNSLLVKDDEETVDLDASQLVRRGRKRKLTVTPLKEEGVTKTPDVKAKIKIEEGLLEIENKHPFDNNGKKELSEGSSSDELQIEKLPLGDDKKKGFHDEKRKSIKKEVKDEYEFDDDISRDSTDAKEFYMSRVDRRKFSLGDGICSSIVSESAPSSPASTSYGDDIEAEKHHRSWKRSIMLIWNDIAAHKNASLFLRPITEDKVPGYHSIVLMPIDLLTIKRNVENGYTKTTCDFQHDIMLMFLNAKMYNTRDHNIYRMADEMMKDVLIFIEEFVNTQMIANAKILETPQKNLRRETRESSAKRGDEKKKDEREEKSIKRRKLS